MTSPERRHCCSASCGCAVPLGLKHSHMTKPPRDESRGYRCVFASRMMLSHRRSVTISEFESHQRTPTKKRRHDRSGRRLDVFPIAIERLLPLRFFFLATLFDHFGLDVGRYLAVTANFHRERSLSLSHTTQVGRVTKSLAKRDFWLRDRPA